MSNSDLSSFIEDVTGESYLRVQEDLGDGFVRLRAKEAQRRQAKQDITCFEDVVLELLRNARDADATAIFVASWKEQGRRFITVLDNGSGIPDHLHDTIFEPFVTSKLDTFHEDRWGVHGRGMALYSIKENVEEAEVLLSEPGAGSVLAVRALTTTLPEKVDQSSLPYIHVTDTGEQVMRGPRNIARIVMEFALDSQGEVKLFLGSPVEIAATIANYEPADPTSNEADGVLDYLKYIYDPESFAERATEIGLPLSARSARRILDEQIAPLEPLLEQLGFERPNGKIVTKSKKTSDENAEGTPITQSSVYHEQRKLKIAPEDLETFEGALRSAFEELASHYYLEQSDAIKVRTSSDKLLITIPFRMER